MPWCKCLSDSKWSKVGILRATTNTFCFYFFFLLINPNPIDTLEKKKAGVTMPLTCIRSTGWRQVTDDVLSPAPAMSQLGLSIPRVNRHFSYLSRLAPSAHSHTLMSVEISVVIDSVLSFDSEAPMWKKYES